jgi:glycosyltransferase involved in cell wall biosynthesis
MLHNSNVAYIIVNNLGGITSLVQNLILFNQNHSLKQKLYLLNVIGNINAPATNFISNRIDYKYLKFHPKDNWYNSLGKIANVLSEQNGLLVSNDQYDLIMLQAYNIPRIVVQLVHDSYNLSLSFKFNDVIDIYVAHSKYIYDVLLNSIPERNSDIFYIPYGIPIIPKFQKNNKSNNLLKLVFLGRHDKEKGIYDLFLIDQILKKNNLFVEWTILGDGPEKNFIKKQWSKAKNVKFLTPESKEELFEILSNQHILVFPSRFEGFPVSILEAMSVGCVPIATNLCGGIQEVVINEKTGYRCEMANIEEFAQKIQFLYHNEDILKSMQRECIDLVNRRHNIIFQAPKYNDLFHKLINQNLTPRHHSVNRKIGSRLDIPYFPSFITKFIRMIINKR